MRNKEAQAVEMRFEQVICREEVAKGENWWELLKRCILIPKLDIKEHMKWAKGAQR